MALGTQLDTTAGTAVRTVWFAALYQNGEPTTNSSAPFGGRSHLTFLFQRQAPYGRGSESEGEQFCC